MIMDIHEKRSELLRLYFAHHSWVLAAKFDKRLTVDMGFPSKGKKQFLLKPSIP